MTLYIYIFSRNYPIRFSPSLNALKDNSSEIANGVIRFNDLQREVDGISSLMLSKNLKELVEDCLVIRHQYNEIPPRVEYELSEFGQKLIVVLESLGKWGCEVYKYKKSSF